MDIGVALLIMALCLLLEGFFSGSEIGVVSADRIRLRHEAAKGSRGAKLALSMLEKPEWLLSTTLIGTNIAVVTNTTIATGVMIELFGEGGSWLAVILVAPLIWVFGEIVPKSIFQQRADTITPYSIFLLKFFSLLFYPILAVFTALTRLFSKLIGGNTDENPFTLREEIDTMLQMPAQGGDIQPVEKAMIRRMFNFSETSVGEVMVPLIDVVAVELKSLAGEAIKTAIEHSHVRLPVYDQRIDQVVGILHTLDLLGLDPETPIAGHVRPVPFVPQSKSIKDLLLELRHSGHVVAVVVDEFGAAEGIVALEDIMEEVVEDLQDEYDTHHHQPRMVKKFGDQDYLVNTRIDITDLNEELGIQLPEGNYQTLGGYLIHVAQEIPAAGSILKIGDYIFSIERGSARTLKEVRLRW